jgi:hypothetical protein
MNFNLPLLAALLLVPRAALHAIIAQSDGDSMTEETMEPRLPAG